MVDPAPAAAALVAALATRGRSLAVAESLTGGLVAVRVTDVPGASAVFRGGVVSYATPVKVDVLGVPAALVEEHGAVSAECALAMAAGVRRLLGADLGLSTTGVAGPDEAEGKPPGWCFVAGTTGTRREVRHLRLPGDRGEVRSAAADAALVLGAELAGDA